MNLMGKVSRTPEPRRILAPLASKRAERGAAAIEFAIVFPLFFLVVYGIIAYGLALFAQQVLTAAAEEGARAALRYVTAGQNAAAATLQPQASACTAANALTAGTLGNLCSAPSVAVANCYGTGMCATVTLNYNGSLLMPSLRIWPLTALLPSTLTGVAQVQLERVDG